VEYAQGPSAPFPANGRANHNHYGSHEDLNALGNIQIGVQRERNQPEFIDKSGGKSSQS